MNITQQVSASIGTALFSVLLTNAYNQHPIGQRRRSPSRAPASDHTKLAAILDQLGHPDRAGRQAIYSTGLHYMGLAFGDVFLVAAILVGLCFIPAFFLPRGRPRSRPTPRDDGRLRAARPPVSCAGASSTRSRRGRLGRARRRPGHRGRARARPRPGLVRGPARPGRPDGQPVVYRPVPARDRQGGPDVPRGGPVLEPGGSLPGHRPVLRHRVDRQHPAHPSLGRLPRPLRLGRAGLRGPDDGRPPGQHRHAAPARDPRHAPLRVLPRLPRDADAQHRDGRRRHRQHVDPRRCRTCWSTWVARRRTTPRASTTSPPPRRSASSNGTPTSAPPASSTPLTWHAVQRGACPLYDLPSTNASP